MKIIVVAHRGKGPTSNFTDPTEELWQECYDNDQLVNKVVSKNNLEKIGRLLPINVFPENTIAAFRQGLEEGADAIELDLFLSKDNIPMVIHDNELNRNVSGARRAAKHVTDVGYLGNIVDYTKEELKKQFDLWNYNRIPSLQEVIDFITLFNKIRSFKGNKPIILNIEFKDKNEFCVKQTLERVAESIEAGKLTAKDVIYCSFDHELLKQVTMTDLTSQVAPAIKTVYLYGKDRVDTLNNWTVELGTKYNELAIIGLEHLITTFQSQNKGKIVALDAVLWDIEPELVVIAKKYDIDLHISTSGFRNFEDKLFIANLVKISQELQVYFKTDEPAKFNALINEAYRATELNTSILSLERKKPISLTNEPSKEETTNYKNTELFLRAPKPGQSCSKEYKANAEKLMGESLKLFVQKSENFNHEIFNSLVTDEDLAKSLTSLELIQYNYWELEG